VLRRWDRTLVCHMAPAPSSIFFDILACPWGMLGHAVSIFRYIYHVCDVPDSIQNPGKSYPTALLPFPHLLFYPPPLYCTPSLVACLNPLHPPIFPTYHPTSWMSADSVPSHSNPPSPSHFAFCHLGLLCCS
jgi:hypothetical protein